MPAEKVTAATKNDLVWCVGIYQKRLVKLTTRPKRVAILLIRNELTIEDGCLLRGIRVVIPKKVPTRFTGRFTFLTSRNGLSAEN